MIDDCQVAFCWQPYEFIITGQICSHRNPDAMLVAG
jgi:hypothetical protein